VALAISPGIGSDGHCLRPVSARNKFYRLGYPCTKRKGESSRVPQCQKSAEQGVGWVAF
jgi:hypothetical protein